jgi:hypothetical protein
MDRIKIFLSWLWVALCTLTIFLIIPLARTIQSFVSRYFGRSLFGYSVIAATVLAFLALLYTLFFRLKIRSPSKYIWLSAVAFLYIYFTLKLWHGPEEAFHFLEYGLLGYFLFKAMSFSIKDKSIYFAAFFLGALVGIFDEILQWAVPGRFWDLRDVGFNALATGLFQVALWKGISPKMISQKIGLKSVKRVSWLAGANFVLLGLCLSNTPQLVASYTKIFPSLAYLQKEELMDEFRHKHKDAEIGIFFSRLTVDELKKTDREKATEYSQVLNDWRDKDYEEYLRSFTSSTFPFLHELRVHIFRRDKYFEESEKKRSEEARRKALFIAYKENLILEKYFSQTIQKSVYKWSEEKSMNIEALIDKSQFYKSPVSASLFGSLNEKKLWTAIFISLICLGLLNFFYTRRHKYL